MIALDSPQARNVKVLDPARSHRYSLLKQKPRESFVRWRLVRGVGG